MKYHFRVHRDRRKYWAECVELEGCHTQASSKAALLKNMHDVLQLFLSEPEESKLLFSLPAKAVKGRNIVEVALDPKVAFAVSLRRARIEAGMTQKEASEKMKLGGLYSYQRLESPRMANPVLETLARVKKLFPKFQVDRII